MNGGIYYILDCKCHSCLAILLFLDAALPHCMIYEILFIYQTHQIWLSTLNKTVDILWMHNNKPVSHMLVPLVAWRELALDYNTLPKMLYIFEHKTYYVLIHAPYAHIVAFWHISNITPMISWSKICCNIITFLYSSNICEILLYNRQLVVITHELIYGVGAAQR